MKPKQVIVLLILSLLLIILFQNRRVIDLYILFWNFRMSQIILLMLVIVLSFSLGYFTHYLVKRRKSNQITKP